MLKLNVLFTTDADGHHLGVIIFHVMINSTRMMSELLYIFPFTYYSFSKLLSPFCCTLYYYKGTSTNDEEVRESEAL